ncbi:MAG: RsmD family RNA methyltransferase [Planctomycetes bacterium]|nr:RsmD family RNA methyltransferase [Planctomycetota bacterium]
MRIIAGTARGRTLLGPKGRDTRPYLDALKERLFNILGDRVADALVWDVFAGPGSVGLEALSRGARFAIFLERGRPALEALRKNIETLGFADRSRVIAGDALRFPPVGEEAADLVFYDPPFPLVEAEPGRLFAHVERLGAAMAGSGLLVFRTPSRFDFPARIAGLAEVDRRDAGVNSLHLLVRDVKGPEVP